MGSKVLIIYKKVANFLGRINTKIILSIFYFTIIPVFKVIFLFVKPRQDLNSKFGYYGNVVVYDQPFSVISVFSKKLK